MSYKIKEKVFPTTDNIKDLKYDNEGLWSISHPEDADIISEMIKLFMNGNDKINILDGTAGLGGNTLSFAKFFTKVHAIEIDEERYKLLENNLSCYDYKNITITNGNSVDYLKEDYDVYFFDPPWGGPKYKNNDSIDLFLGENILTEIVKLIPEDKCVVFKVPYNFNINLLKDYNLVMKKVRNILIILLISSIVK